MIFRYWIFGFKLIYRLARFCFKWVFEDTIFVLNVEIIRCDGNIIGKLEDRFRKKIYQSSKLLHPSGPKAQGSDEKHVDT